jgi:hypothetical protein
MRHEARRFAATLAVALLIACHRGSDGISADRPDSGLRPAPSASSSTRSLSSLSATERETLCAWRVQTLFSDCTPFGRRLAYDDYCLNDEQLWACSGSVEDYKECVLAHLAHDEVASAKICAAFAHGACPIPESRRKECPLMVGSLDPGAPAQAAGISVGDVLVRLEGESIDATLGDHFREVTEHSPAGVTLVVRTGTAERTLVVAPKGGRLGIGLGSAPRCAGLMVPAAPFIPCNIE